jgi:hypothetical protein
MERDEMIKTAGRTKGATESRVDLASGARWGDKDGRLNQRNLFRERSVPRANGPAFRANENACLLNALPFNIRDDGQKEGNTRRSSRAMKTHTSVIWLFLGHNLSDPSPCSTPEWCPIELVKGKGKGKVYIGGVL